MVSLNLFTIIVVAALVGAWQLGRMQATDPKRWKAGTLKQFGWKAWRPILWGLVAAAALLTLVGEEVRARIPFMSGFGVGGGMGGGMGMGGMGGGYGGY